MKTIKGFLTSGYMFINVVCLFFVVGFFIGAVLVKKDREVLGDRGLESTATIVDKYSESEMIPGRSVASRMVYVIDYDFPLKNGELFRSGRQIHKDVWDQVTIQHTFSLIYDPEDPHIHDSHLALYSEEEELLLGLGFFFVFIIFLLSFIGFIHSFVRVRKNKG